MSDTYTRLVDLLEAGGARYRLIDHPAEGRTEEASRLRGHGLAPSAKSLVVRVSLTKRTGRYLLAVVSGHDQVDLDELARLGGGSKAVLAARHVAEQLTGAVSGSIPPVAFDPGLELLVDPALLEHEEIFFNAARLDRSLAVRTADYLRLVRPRVAPIAAPALERAS